MGWRLLMLGHSWEQSTSPNTIPERTPRRMTKEANRPGLAVRFEPIMAA